MKPRMTGHFVTKHKRVIRSCKWKERQYNGQKTNNDLQNITQKTKD